MKVISLQALGLLLALMLSATAAAQFAEKNAAFQEPGAGQENREYMFLVPERITIETRKGEIIKGGETIAIPGNLITLLSSEQAEQEAPQAFNGQTQMTESQKKDYAVIELTIPEGVTIRQEDDPRTDGISEEKTVQGEQTLVLLVSANSMQMSDEMTEPPKEVHKMTVGFEEKSN